LRKDGAMSILTLHLERIYVHRVSFAGSCDPGWDETTMTDGHVRVGM
jgi:hypothetical protein